MKYVVAGKKLKIKPSFHSTNVNLFSFTYLTSSQRALRNKYNIYLLLPIFRTVRIRSVCSLVFFHTGSMKLGKKTLITRRTSLTRRAVISTVPYMSNTAYLVASPIMGPWSVLCTMKRKSISVPDSPAWYQR
jgi:hypothetical protein